MIWDVQYIFLTEISALRFDTKSQLVHLYIFICSLLDAGTVLVFHNNFHRKHIIIMASIKRFVHNAILLHEKPCRKLLKAMF